MKEATPGTAAEIEAPASSPGAPPERAELPGAQPQPGGAITGAAFRIPSILLEGDEPSASPSPEAVQKYSLGPGPPAEPLRGEEGELPEAYGTGRLLLIAREPHWLYAQWDLTSDQQRRLNERSAHHHLLVRLHHDAVAEQPVAEIHAQPESRHCFVPVEQAGRKYVAELGYYQSEGRWFALARSAAVTSPSDSLAEDKTVRFGTFAPEPTLPLTTAPVSAAPAQTKPPEKPSSPARVTETLKSVALPQFDWVPGFVRAVQAAARSPAPLLEMLRRTFPSSPVPGSSPASEWTPAQEHALAELVNQSEQWVDSLAVIELVRRQLGGRPQPAGPVTAMDLVQLAGEGWPAVPGGISSAPGQPSARKGFWFNVNAELVIYGATEPGATVTIGGQPIELRPDGTFSYRFSLPDGQYELPIVAAAPSGERREAHLQFRRQTRYHGEVGASEPNAKLAPPPGP